MFNFNLKDVKYKNHNLILIKIHNSDMYSQKLSERHFLQSYFNFLGIFLNKIFYVINTIQNGIVGERTKEILKHDPKNHFFQ